MTFTDIKGFVEYIYSFARLLLSSSNLHQAASKLLGLLFIYLFTQKQYITQNTRQYTIIVQKHNNETQTNKTDSSNSFILTKVNININSFIYTLFSTFHLSHPSQHSPESTMFSWGYLQEGKELDTFFFWLLNHRRSS